MPREIVTSENRDDYIAKKLSKKSGKKESKLPEKKGYKYGLIPLSHIEHGESATRGGKLTLPGAKDLIKKYASMKTEAPPIELTSNDEGDKVPWMIYDGSHRYEAAKLKGHTHIPAWVSEYDKEGIEKLKQYS